MELTLLNSLMAYREFSVKFVITS